MQDHAPRRIVIYAKDLMMLTGKCERSCRKLLHEIRLSNKKPPGCPVTVHELCDYIKCSEEEVFKALNL